MMEYVKRAEEPNKRAPNGERWNNLREKVNKVLLAYNPKYKINVLEFILV